MVSLAFSPLPSASFASSPSLNSHRSPSQSSLLFSFGSTPKNAFLSKSPLGHSQSLCRKSLLVKAEIKYVDPSEAKKLVAEEGYTVLDIRDRTQYERAHIVPCVHIPVYIENTDNDIGTIINRTLHNNFSGLFYGLAFTKPNPEFISSVQKKFPKDSKLLLVCQEGLRSGAAANKLQTAGFEDVAYISSGLQTVNPGIFEKEGPQELRDAGKGGLVTIQGKISAVLGTVLIAAYLFITFFPNQAELLFFSNK